MVVTKVALGQEFGDPPHSTCKYYTDDFSSPISTPNLPTTPQYRDSEALCVATGWPFSRPEGSRGPALALLNLNKVQKCFLALQETSTSCWLYISTII